jgi:hypothetical protein
MLYFDARDTGLTKSSFSFSCGILISSIFSSAIDFYTSLAISYRLIFYCVTKCKGPSDALSE